MPISTQTVVYDVEDAKVAPLTADNATLKTYGALVDVPGIAEVSVDPNLITAELKGDGGRVLAKKGKVDRMTMSATYGKLAMDVLQTVLGGAVVASGVTPNQKNAWELLGGASLPYFYLSFQIIDVDLGIGDVHVELFKCQLTGGTLLSGATDSFGQPTMEVEAIGRENDKKMVAVSINETAAAIAAPA
jgi:copper chaperone CopZ